MQVLDHPGGGEVFPRHHPNCFVQWSQACGTEDSTMHDGQGLSADFDWRWQANVSSLCLCY